MHQAILVHADVDEGAKGGHVGDHAFENHVRAQVADFFHAFLEGGGGELRTRVAARLFQFLQNIGNGRHAKRFIGVLCRAEGFQQRCFADDGLDILLDVRQNLFHQRVRFRVDGRSVQGIVAAHHAQEAGRLFKRLVAQARHGFQGRA